MQKKKHLDRRHFLKTSALGVICAGAAIIPGTSCSPKKQQEKEIETEDKAKNKIKDYRILGRTGFKVSDLATGSIRDEGLLAAMLDAGVNYIDTAESYPGHHRIVSQAIKDRDRKSLFITSKMLLEGEFTKEGLLDRARKALEELESEYIDCMMMHAPEKAETLKNEAFHAAMDQLKAEGVIRYVGVSNHGSFWFKDSEETMGEVLLAAADDGRFDVMLMAYNFLQMDQAEQVLEACNEKNIGAVLMKTTPVTNYYRVKSYVEQQEKEGKDINPLYKEGLERFKAQADMAEKFIEEHDLKSPEEIKDAAIRFVLSNPNVNSVCCSLKTYDDMERVLKLSGSRLSDLDKKKLAAFKEGCGKLYCRHACGVCEPSCPNNVPVNTIMRYNHYFIAQGREREAMLKYAAIPNPKADKCSECPGHCETACPHQVPIQGMLLVAHQTLSLTA